MSAEHQIGRSREGAITQESRQLNQNMTAENDAMSRQEQLKVAREMSQGGGGSPQLPGRPPEANVDPVGDVVNRNLEQMINGQGPVLHDWDPTAAERQQAATDAANKERAGTIADTIKKDASGEFWNNEQDQLNLRIDLADLQNVSPAVREQVFTDLQEDCSKWYITGCPAATIERDANGNPTDITFSLVLAGSRTIPLDQSVCEQALDEYNGANADTQTIVQKDLAMGRTDNYWYEGVLQPVAGSAYGQMECRPPEAVKHSDLGMGDIVADNTYYPGDAYFDFDPDFGAQSAEFYDFGAPYGSFSYGGGNYDDVYSCGSGDA